MKAARKPGSQNGPLPVMVPTISWPRSRWANSQHLLVGYFDFFEDALGALEQDAAGFGQGQVAAAAFEQAHAELVLEELYLLGQRSLTHVELVRGATEPTSSGDLGQVMKLTELHEGSTPVGG